MASRGLVLRFVALFAALALAQARFLTEDQLLELFPATPSISLIELETPPVPTATAAVPAAATVPLSTTAPLSTAAPALPICGLQTRANKDSLEPIDVVPESAVASCRVFPGLDTLLNLYSRSSLARMSIDELKTLLEKARQPKPKVSRQSKKRIARECPRALCPANITCAEPNAHCCRGGKTCCPADSTCVNTDPPTCLRENKTDPFRCLNQACRPGLDCPHANVGACCLGGQTCCPSNAACTEDGACRVLSRIEFLFQRQLDPVETKRPEDFGDVEMPPPSEIMIPPAPIAVVPEGPDATPSPETLPMGEEYDEATKVVPALIELEGRPKKAPLSPGGAQQLVMKDALGNDLPVNTELFPTPPVKEGEREQEKVEIVGKRRYRIYEKQSSSLVDGRLRTVTTHKTIIDDPASGVTDDEFKLRTDTAAKKIEALKSAIPLSEPRKPSLQVVVVAPPARNKTAPSAGEEEP